MKAAFLALAIAAYLGSIIAPAFAACPPGTAYRCVQGYNGKVVCGCS